MEIKPLQSKYDKDLTLDRITYRQWLAGMALQGLLARGGALNPLNHKAAKDLGESCWAAADALLSAQEEK